MEKYKKIFKKYDVDAILLQSFDDFTIQHIPKSELTRITGFSGTAGEAVITREGKIYLFVDPRYHIQAEKTANKNVTVIKMQMGEGFITLLQNYISKDTKLLVDSKYVTYDFYKLIKSRFKNVAADSFIERCPKSITEYSIKTDKIEKLKNKLKMYKARNILITDTEHVSYLTGLNDHKTPYSSAIRAKLLINEKNTLIFDETPKLKGKTILYEENLPLYDFLMTENPILLKKNHIAEMMSVKTKKEIDCFKDSFKRLDEALYNFRDKIKIGLSEYELNKIFEHEIYKTGADALSFKTILSVGENTASIHYSNYDKNKILKEDDLLLLDCGGYWKSPLATDITRVFTGGKPTDEQKYIYTIVLKAFLNCYHAPFGTGLELDALARKIFEDEKIKGFTFPHGLGHGLGYNVHSFPPVISPKGVQKLKRGMTFTIEPGLYLENKFGVRLENSVYMGNKNIKHSFSKFPFESNLIDLKFLNEKEISYLRDWQNGR